MIGFTTITTTLERALILKAGKFVFISALAGSYVFGLTPDIF